MRYADYMYVYVKLLKGLSKKLTYAIPTSWQHDTFIGKLVRVPVKNREHTALVVGQTDERPTGHTFAIKDVTSIEPFPDDPHYYAFITELTSYYQTEPTFFIKRIQHFLHQKEQAELPHEPSASSPLNTTNVTLTQEQQAIVDALAPKIHHNKYTPTVIHGVTSSGKTEIYKALLHQALHEHKSAILLLPEVTLALQFEKILRAQMESGTPIYGFHSATSMKLKRYAWQQLLNKKPIIIIGVHIPLLLPLANLGLIIIDEEHDAGYQEKKHPKVNSKEAALLRAKKYGVPIVLGSATPAISSLYNVKQRNWLFFQLKKRFSGAFPTIKTVFLTEKKERRRSFWISKELEQAISDRLHKKEQVILFLNRRGFSFFVQCKKCSYTFMCSNCSVSLTLHQGNMLHCHYCGMKKQLPASCPNCATSEKNFIKKGVGTQQIVTVLERLFPQARVGRADLDTTAQKKTWRQTLNAFEQQELDILVGTQTITKGYHFPNVTLVGMLWADINIHFPMYNAAETALQQLIQVAGRAGRNHKESLVIAQTMIDHPIFDYLNERDYLTFYTQEMEKRTLLCYPPYYRLIEIELKDTKEERIEHEAKSLFMLLSRAAHQHAHDIYILGPSTPPVHKIKHMYARKIYMKGSSIATLVQVFRSIDTTQFSSLIYFTPNPLH